MPSPIYNDACLWSFSEASWQPFTDDELETVEGMQAETAAYRDAYSEDYRQRIAVGQLSEHTGTLLKG